MEEKVLAQAIDFSRMPTAASYQFIYDQERRMVVSEKVYQVMEAPLLTLHKAVAAFDKELKRSAKDLLTDKIRPADTNMDHAYTGLKEVVRAMTLYPPTDAMREAVTRAWQKFKDYGIDVTMDMNAEMGLMANLLHDLRTAPLKDDMQTLGLTQWVTTLYNCYNTLHDLVIQRTNEQATVNPRQLTQTRLEAEAQYRNVIRLLNAHILLEGDTDYKDCVAQLNAEVAHYNQTVIARRKGKKSSDDEPETDGETDNGETKE